MKLRWLFTEPSSADPEMLKHIQVRDAFHTVLLVVGGLLVFVVFLLLALEKITQSK